MQLLLVGHGQMGQMVESLAGEYGCTVAGVIDPLSPSGHDGPDADRWQGVEVAIDFSTPDAVATNVPVLLARGHQRRHRHHGWQKDEPAIRGGGGRRGRGVVAAPNFSTGVQAVRGDRRAGRGARARRRANSARGSTKRITSTKKDAPSGTALSLKKTMEEAGFPRPIDVSSTRAGHIPGTHTVGFDGPAETITLTHTARDRRRSRAARSSAAKWVQRETRLVHDARRAGSLKSAGLQAAGSAGRVGRWSG